MNEQERELLQKELEEYVDEWATSYRDKFGPEELPDKQTLKEELQIFRSALEGYAYGILRGWRLHQVKTKNESFNHSETLLDTQDYDQLDDLIESKMRVYLDSLKETAPNS